MRESVRNDLRKIEAWLRKKFATPYPVRVIVRRIARKEKARATTERVGKRIVITINERLNWDLAVDCLLHEFAHAVDFRHESVERRRPDHDDQWALAYGKVYRSFWDEGGREEAGV